MTERTPAWSDILAGLSAFLAGVSFYLNVQPLSTLFSVLVGALVTYSVQRRLQNAAEKRSRNVQNIDDYYGPLLLAIEEFREAGPINLPSQTQSNLHAFKKHPKFYTMGGSLRDDFNTFLNDLLTFNNSLWYYKGRASYYVAEKGITYLAPKEVNKANPRITGLVNESGTSLVWLRYKHAGENFAVTFTDCILKQTELTEAVRLQVPSLNENDLTLEYQLETVDELKRLGRISETKPFREVAEALPKIFDEVSSELSKDADYRAFQTLRKRLEDEADSLSSRLTEYVTRYVSIVNL